MRPKLLLRIAAVLMLLHTAGHTFGALGWAQPPSKNVAPVIRGMETEHFEFMGRNTTLAAFFNGYGISMIFVLLFVAVQLWLLASYPQRTMICYMGVFLVLLVFCEYIFFFPMAALFTLICAVCTWISFIKYERA